MAVASRWAGLVRWGIASAVVTGLFACDLHHTTAPLTVATSNLTVSLSAANIAALVPAASAAPTTFTFNNGFSGVNTAASSAPITLTGPTTVAITGTGSAPTFTITNGGGTATGPLAFGSCDFNVSGLTGTVPGITIGTVISENPCQVTLELSGQQVGQGVTVQVTFTLGTATSGGNTQVNVTISTNGTVTVNGVQIGTVTTGASSGSTGSTGTTGGSG